MRVAVAVAVVVLSRAPIIVSEATRSKINECSMSGYERKKTAEAFLEFCHLHP